MKLREQLFSLIDNEYKKFNQKLTPGDDMIIGVRVPELRKIAKEIAKNDYKSYLDNAVIEYSEEKLIYGFVLGYIKTDIQIILKYLTNWLEFVNSWGVCDSSMMSLKFKKLSDRETYLRYCINTLQSTSKPFIKRAMIVAMYDYFDDANIDQIMGIYVTIFDDDYYVKMALAWGISIILAKNYDKGLSLLAKKTLSPWVQNKGIQKARESLRLTKTQKEEVTLLKM